MDLSACASQQSKGTGVVSQNDQHLKLIELFVKWCQYFLLLEWSNGFVINKQTVLTFGKCLQLLRLFSMISISG